MSKKTALVYAVISIASIGAGYLIANRVAKKISAKLIPNELKQTGKKQAAQIFNPEPVAPVEPVVPTTPADIPPYAAQMDVETFDPSTPHHPYAPVTLEKLKGLEERGWTVKYK